MKNKSGKFLKYKVLIKYEIVEDPIQSVDIHIPTLNQWILFFDQKVTIKTKIIFYFQIYSTISKFKYWITQKWKFS